MYFLFPHRLTLPTAAPYERLHELVSREQLALLTQQDAQAEICRWEDRNEWLAPVARMQWENGQHTRVALWPRRWLRRILRIEMLLFVSLMSWLLIEAHYFLALLVVGMVLLNHSVIYLIMRRRFRHMADWLREQFG